ncbi:dephospho-CoA kinase [Cognatiyoonia sp.]|uniref:dephospho-CoA kinase n=1 Tax=Cognatiyoonia sp. TaxID=2211652 RepID=UPI003F6971F2
MTKFWLGLTGSIGMGKSTTADMFHDAGVKVWDADETVHELYAEGGAAVPLIADVYPEAIVDGAVSRPVLKNIIAGDLAALGVIESIVHPLVTQSREVFQDQNNGLIVFDIPLLFEIKADDWLDAVLVVSTPEHIQHERVFARPGMTEELFEDISSRQLPDDEKRDRADFVIETISIDQTRKEVSDLIAELKGRIVDA